MPQSMRFNYRLFPGPTTDMLYLWKDLGRGSKGRVFLACDTAGNVCAVKFFLINDSMWHREEGRRDEGRAYRQTQMKIKEEEANREKGYWLKGYGDTFKDQVRVMKWNSNWCLMMPHFDKVPQSQKVACLDSIRRHLDRFKRESLHYNTDDLRWRHIGVRETGLYTFSTLDLLTLTSMRLL